MKRLINALWGTVTVVVTGVELERLLNQLAKEGVRFWSVDRREAFVLSLKLPMRGLPLLQQMAERLHCSVTVEGEWGLPFFLRRFRRRYALMAGVLLCLALVGIGSNFIFVIDIQGNETVADAEILSQLRQLGIKPGTYGPSIEQRELANRMLLAMDELAYFSLNLYGTRAEVIVRERIPKPELVQEEEPNHVRSTATGIITHMEVLKGDAMVKEGDTVLEGELLISGYIDIKEAEYSDAADLGSSLVHARGRVYARTWRTLVAKMPVNAQLKALTGEEKSRYSLNLLGRRLKFYGNGGISFEKYDKITSTKTWVLSDGSILPISLERETFRQYETSQAELEEQAARTLLEEQLLEDLFVLIGEEGEVIRRDFVFRQADGFLEVTLLAECTEQIGEEVAFQQEELPSAEGGLQVPGALPPQ